MLYRARNPHGGDIYQDEVVLDYSSNINPFGTPEGVIDAMRSALQDVRNYPDPYCRDLVRAISSFEQVPQEHILCGNGAAELVYAYCRAAKLNRAVELAPTFSEYSSALKRVGCRVDRYVLRKGNYFVLDEGFLEYLNERKPQAVFLCNPNNPTGCLIPMDLLERILEFCHQYSVRLFVDECFLDLSDDGVSMKGYLKNHPELFILKAFTKSFGMPGVRLGYCLTSDGDLLEKMSRETQPWNVSLLAQAAGVAATQERTFISKAKNLIMSERAWLTEELEALGFWVCPSKANYLLFKANPGLDASLRECGIAIRNCDNYHGLSSGWYRVAVRLGRQNEQLIAAIEKVCRKE